MFYYRVAYGEKSYKLIQIKQIFLGVPQILSPAALQLLETFGTSDQGRAVCFLRLALLI